VNINLETDPNSNKINVLFKRNIHFGTPRSDYEFMVSWSLKYVGSPGI